MARIPGSLALALFRAGVVGPEADLRAVMWVGLRALAVAVPLLVLMIGYGRWRGRDGLGLGDAKLTGVSGARFGFVTIFAVIELATLSALSAYVISDCCTSVR